VILYNSAPIISFVLATSQISTLGENEVEFTLTPKGVNNNAMNTPANSPRRRRRSAKKAAPTMMVKVIHNSQVSRKRTLDEYKK
jgi:hypothetical protein